MVHVDVLYQGVTDQNLTLSIICFFLSLLVLCFPCCLFVPDVRCACSVACTNFTIQLFHVFVVLFFFFFFSLPFLLSCSEQTKPSLQDFLLFSVHPSSCCTLLAGDQALKPSVRCGKGVCRAVWPDCHLVPLSSWDRTIRALWSLVGAQMFVITFVFFNPEVLANIFECV